MLSLDKLRQLRKLCALTSCVNKIIHTYLYNVFSKIGENSFSTYSKIFRKTNISYPLTHTRTCAYQGVRNVSFSEKFLSDH